MQAYLARPSSTANTKPITKTPDYKGNASFSSSSSSSSSAAFPTSSSLSSSSILPSSSTVPPPSTRSSSSSTGTTELKSAMLANKSGGSKKALLTSYMTATEGMTSKQKQAYLLKRRADEARLQQLRGIFATYDEDRDNELNEKELSLALLALGLDPSPRTLQRFYLASPNGKVDLATFVRICMTRSGITPNTMSIDETETTENRILNIFKEFDPLHTGRVSLSTLLHILAEVDSPSALGVDEIQELLRMTGILNESTLRDPRTLYAMEVDYRAFIRHLMFTPSTATTPSTVSANASSSSTAVNNPSSLASKYNTVNTLTGSSRRSTTGSTTASSVTRTYKY